MARTVKTLPSTTRQAGMSLLEIMVSLTILFIGMLTLFKVITVSIQTNVISRNLATATTKAQDHMEALKEVPTETLACLAGGSAPAACRSSCVNGGTDLEHCDLALGLNTDHNTDGHGVVFTPSFGVIVGSIANTYEIEVVSQWMGEETPPRPHRIYLKTTVFR